jgi:hypothetical protein
MVCGIAGPETIGFALMRAAPMGSVAIPGALMRGVPILAAPMLSVAMLLVLSGDVQMLSTLKKFRTSVDMLLSSANVQVPSGPLRVPV